MLSADKLQQKLQEFCDPDYLGTPPFSPRFSGYPGNRDAARTKWAAAFFAYIDDASESHGSHLGHTALSMATVQSSFRGDLDLDNSISAAQAAADFAGAWQSAVAAITAGATTVEPANPPTAPYSATYSLFQGFTNTTTQHDNLKNTLEALFARPTISVAQRLGQIAAAFHTATTGITGSITQTINSPTPATSIVTIALE